MNIVVDAMGSDKRPVPDVAGGILAAQAWGEEITFVGDEALIRRELAKYETKGLKLHIQHAADQIEMGDKPSIVAREKPNSSIHIGLGLVQSGQADAFVSAGNTGVTLTVAMLHTLKRIRGVKRPALATTFPFPNTPLLIDSGANTDCKAEWLVQFALMGEIYTQAVRGLVRPKIGLLSNGEEEGKGNELIQAAYSLLKERSLNFIGYVEPKEFFNGVVEIGVTDGLIGNLVLKSAESISKLLLTQLKTALYRSRRTQIGAWLARPAFDQIRQQLSADAVGGSPLLGVNGVVIVCHGNSSPVAIQHGIGQARLAVQKEIVAAIRTQFEKKEEL